MGQTGRSTLRSGDRTKKSRQKDKAGQDDVKRQIDSDLNDSKQIYQLVNVKTGGGKLIDIIKSRVRHHSVHSSSGSFDDDEIRGAPSHDRSRVATRAANQKLMQEYENETDQQIRSLVEPLLYNKGRGRLLPLTRIWQFRFGAASGTGTEMSLSEATMRSSASLVEPEEEPGAGATPTTPDRRSRWVCWRLEERGFVGETALHICFLLSTPTHMILAKRLLNLFPMLINDIYTCDEYFGESSLHMAIVNEDVRILKLLLDHGANVHERCLGSFFLPNDQKDKANGTIRRRLLGQAADQTEPLEDFGLDLLSNSFSDPHTNYEGYTYWGEYPLSFAASLGLADCYKLLLAKGANPNRLDSNGNSTLHICVIANRRDMFDLCYSNGAQLGLHNKVGFSPLTLAAKLRRVEMFFHILTIMRQVNWIFCNVGFVDIPLGEIDSVDPRDGSCNDQSVLSIVVSGNSNEHLQMLDGLLSDLLQIKWESSVRGIFRFWLVMFIVFLCVASVAYLTRLDIRTASRWVEKFDATSRATNATKKLDRDLLLYRVATDYKLANHYSELALVCCVAYYLFVLGERCLKESAQVNTNAVQPNENATPTRRRLSGGLVRILVQAPELMIFTFNCILIVLCIPLRFLFQWRAAEDFLATTIMFLMPLKLLFFCRGSKSLGSFIVMIYKILVNDVLCFVVFLIIFIAGFSQSFMLIFKTYRPPPPTSNATAAANLFETLVRENDSYFLNFYDSFIMLHMMALNEFSWVVDEFSATEYPNLARILFCIYMILVSILLVNMLIAMLGKTYQDIASQPNENLRQWARALLTVERMCSRATRLRMLDRYSTEKPPAANRPLAKEPLKHFQAHSGIANRCFSSTWALSEEDRKKIDAIKRLNAEHELNSKRLARSSDSTAYSIQKG